MNASQRPDSLEPGEFLQVLRRRWWIVVGLVIVCGLGAVGYLKVAHKEYTATASVYVIATAADASQVSGGRTTGSVDMDSEAQLVQSITVATIAEHLLHKNVAPAGLISHILVTVPANSQVLQISCTQHTADDAAACAQAFATAYLQNRSTTSANELNAQLSTLRTQATPLQQDVANLQAKIAALPANSSQRATAQAQLSSDENQLSALTHQMGVIAGEQANSSDGSIITNAAPPTKPTSPKPLLVLPSGLAVGLLVGLILAFLVDRRDKRVRSAADVERYLDLPVLLALPTKHRKPLPTLAARRSRAGQMFADLADSTAAALGEGNHVLFVAGASQGTGASVAAASLATALVRTQPDIVLICADVHHSVIPELLGLSRGRGLAEVLAGTATVSEATQRPTDTPRLRVITPGLNTDAVLYDFQQDVNRKLISELRREASMVIIEAQAAGTSADTFSLAEFADTALIVAEIGGTQRPQIVETLQRLDRLRTPVLGAVLIPQFGVPATPAPTGGRETVRRKVGPVGDGPGLSSQRHSAMQVTPGGNSDGSERDLAETRPLPLPVQQAMADRHGATQSSGREGAEPTGKNAEG
jgi:capsular polysaccharide biosynthesis protein